MSITWLAFWLVAWSWLALLGAAVTQVYIEKPYWKVYATVFFSPFVWFSVIIMSPVLGILSVIEMWKLFTKKVATGKTLGEGAERYFNEGDS